MSTTTKNKSKKRKVQITESGIANIKATANNIIINIANLMGQTVSWSSAGKMGFKGVKKSTQLAAQMASRDCAKKAIDLGIKKVEKVCVKGIGMGRDMAIRTLHESGLTIEKIVDITPIPHNGCRPPAIRKP